MCIGFKIRLNLKNGTVRNRASNLLGTLSLSCPKAGQGFMFNYLTEVTVTI